MTGGDVNNDGFEDIIGRNEVFLGNGDGTFSRLAIPSVDNGDPTSVLSADYDGDGNLDIAVTEKDTDSINIALGNGDGTFGAETVLSVGDFPLDAKSGDFNGDGSVDLITHHRIGI